MAKSKKVRLPPVPVLTLSGEGAPTVERLQRAGVCVAMQIGTRRVQIVGPKRDRPIGDGGVVRMAEAPLDRLAARGRLCEGGAQADRKRLAFENRMLFEAGKRLRQHHFMGGMIGFAANDLTRSGGGDPGHALPITERQQGHRDELRRAERDPLMHEGDWRVVYDVVCREFTLEEAGGAAGYVHTHAASAVALDRLRRGLRRLAEIWGHLPPRRFEALEAANAQAA